MEQSVLKLICPTGGGGDLAINRSFGFGGEGGSRARKVVTRVDIESTGLYFRIHLCSKPDAGVQRATDGEPSCLCVASARDRSLTALHNLQNSQRRMNLVIGTSIGSAAGIYEIIGLLGYLTFGSKVGSKWVRISKSIPQCNFSAHHISGFSIVEQYPDSPAVAICRLGIVILVLFSYPLQLHPCRNSLDKVFRSRSKEGALVVGRSEGGDGDDTDVDEDHGSADDIPLGKFVTLTSVILLVTFVISMLVSQLELVCSLLPSTLNVEDMTY